MHGLQSASLRFSFAFSFVTSVKTELSLLTTNWKNSMACLAFHSYRLVPRCCYSFDLDLHQEKEGMILVSRLKL